MYNIMKVEENSLLYIKNQQCSQGAVFTHTIWMPCSKTVFAVCVNIPTVHWILACSIDNKKLFQQGSMRCVYTMPKYHNIPCHKMTSCLYLSHPIYSYIQSRKQSRGPQVPSSKTPIPSAWETRRKGAVHVECSKSADQVVYNCPHHGAQGLQNTQLSYQNANEIVLYDVRCGMISSPFKTLSVFFSLFLYISTFVCWSVFVAILPRHRSFEAPISMGAWPEIRAVNAGRCAFLRLCSTSLNWIAIKQLTSRVSFKNEGARRTCFTVLELHTMRNELVACCRWQVRVISCSKPSKLEAAEPKWQWFKIRGYFSGPWIWASIICQPSSFGGRITEYWGILPNVAQESLQPSWLQRPVGHSVQLEDLGVLHVPAGHTKPVTYQKLSLKWELWLQTCSTTVTWSRNCINRLQFIQDVLIWFDFVKKNQATRILRMKGLFLKHSKASVK